MIGGDRALRADRIYGGRMPRYYHRTDPADPILREGFIDGDDVASAVKLLAGSLGL